MLLKSQSQQPQHFIIGNRESISGNARLFAKSCFSRDDTIAVCWTSYSRNDSRRMQLAIRFIAGATTFIFIIELILFRWYLQNQEDSLERKENSSWRLTTFHNLSFNAEEISMVLLLKEDKNMIGSEASGKVYRVDLPNNETVAVKHLWTSTRMDMDDINMDKYKNYYKKQWGPFATKT